MIDALFDLLGTFYQSGDLLQAESIARSILQAIPDDIVSLQLLGLVYYRTQRRDQAMQAFRVADAAAGVPARGELSLQASAQCLQAASAHGSTLANAWYELGLILFRLRRYPQAIRALRAALSARPGCGKVERAIARIASFSPSGSAAPSGRAGVSTRARKR